MNARKKQKVRTKVPIAVSNKPVTRFVHKDKLDALRERFERRFKETKTGCWLWEGPLFHGAYGQIAVNGRPRLAHRVAWEIYRGPISAGQMICHVDGHPAGHSHCVNPDHLVERTQPPVLKGSQQPKAKLNEPVIKRLRVQYAKPLPKVFTQKDFATKYKASRILIRKIAAGKYKAGEKFDRRTVTKIRRELLQAQKLRQERSVTLQAKALKVSPGTLRSALRFDTWRHVGGAGKAA